MPGVMPSSGAPWPDWSLRHEGGHQSVGESPTIGASDGNQLKSIGYFSSLFLLIACQDRLLAGNALLSFLVNGGRSRFADGIGECGDGHSSSIGEIR